MWFEAIFRLKVNSDKSEIIQLENVESVNDLVKEFRHNIGTLLSTHLGLPLGGAPFRFVAVWDGVEERSHRRFAM